LEKINEGKIPCPKIQRNVAKIAIQPRAIYRCNVIPIMVPMSHLMEIEKNPKIYTELQKG
jgi:hypothetical protein